MFSCFTKHSMHSMQIIVTFNTANNFRKFEHLVKNKWKMKIHKYLFCQLVIVLTIIHSTLANLPEPSILEFNLSKVSILPMSGNRFSTKKITMTAAIVVMIFHWNMFRLFQEDYAIQIPITLLQKTKLNVAGESKSPLNHTTKFNRFFSFSFMWIVQKLFSGHHKLWIYRTDMQGRAS